MKEQLLHLGLLILFFLVVFTLSTLCIGFLFRKGKAGRIAAVLIAVAIAFLPSKCAWIYQKHNREAQQLLTSLQEVSLPPDARVLKEDSEVGSYNAATGDATDILAYRIFVSDLPRSIVEAFTPQERSESFLGLCRLSEPPHGGPYLPMDAITAKVPHEDRSHAYILYKTGRCDEDIIWDIRGW